MTRKPQIITIGDSFTARYIFYQPKTVAGKTVPDYDNPTDLTGYTIKFVVIASGAETAFDVSLTPLAGTVVVNLTPAQTAAYINNRGGKSFLRRTKNGRIESRAQRDVKFLPQGERD